MFNKDDFTWQYNINGTSLIIMGATIDSFMIAIQHGVSYDVGKHKQNKKVIIMPHDAALNMKDKITFGMCMN